MAKFYQFFDRYFFLILIFVSIFVPLYPKFPLLGVANTYVAIRLEDVLILAVAGLWLLGNIRYLRLYYRERIFQAIVLFWLIGGLTVFSGIFIDHTIVWNLGILHWLRRIEYMSLFLMAATSLRSSRQLKWMIYSILITTVLVVAYGFGQIFLNFPVISTTNREFSKGLILYLAQGARVNSTFAGHYDLAMYLSIVLMIFGSLFFYYKKAFKLWPLVVSGGAFVLLGLTAARVSFVATIIGLIWVLWLQKKRWMIILLLIMAFGVVGIIPELRHRLVATLTVNILQGGGPKYSPPPGTITKFTPSNQLPENLKGAALEKRITDATIEGAIYADTVAGEPINPTELGVARSFDIRTDVEWPRALNAFKKNPILGTGYSSLSLATDNDFLRSLGETGLLGTLSLFLVFFIIYKKLLWFVGRSTSLEHAFIIGVISAGLALAITATFIDVLEASKIAEVFWLLLGTSWAAVVRYQHRND